MPMRSSTRVRTLTQKAEEAFSRGERIPGTSGELWTSLSFPMAASSSCEASQAPQTLAKQPAQIPTAMKRKAEQMVAACKRPKALVSKPKKSSKPCEGLVMPNLPHILDRANQNENSFRTQELTETPDGRELPIFSEITLPIYLWPYPRPTDFTNLSRGHAEWKEKIDVSGEDLQSDSEEDDWYEFTSDPNVYTRNSTLGNFALEFAVARTFVNRAKRAFRAGKSWALFEAEELALNSMAVAEAEPDQRRREVLLETALNNELRLAVFHLIEERLCNEVWLEKHPAQQKPPLPLATLPPKTPIDPAEKTVKDWGRIDVDHLDRIDDDGWIPLYYGENGDLEGV